MTWFTAKQEAIELLLDWRPLVQKAPLGPCNALTGNGSRSHLLCSKNLFPSFGTSWYHAVESPDFQPLAFGLWPARRRLGFAAAQLLRHPRPQVAYPSACLLPWRSAMPAQKEKGSGDLPKHNSVPRIARKLPRLTATGKVASASWQRNTRLRLGLFSDAPWRIKRSFLPTRDRPIAALSVQNPSKNPIF